MLPDDLIRSVQILSEAIMRYSTAVVPSPGLAFVQKKDDAHRLAELLEQESGVEVPVVTGDVSVADREKIAQRMKLGEVKAVVATDAWSAGIDIPCVRWVAVEAWTRAPIGVQQRVGRGSRIAEGKEDFDLIVLPGKYEQDIKRIVSDSGQASQILLPPGSAQELAGFLCYERQPRGRNSRRAQLTRAEEPPVRGANDWITWLFAIILGSGMLLKFFGC